MPRHIVILVENESVPRDRRVWQESRALTEAGFQVTVICPIGTDRDHERDVTIDGVRILRFPLREATNGPLGYVREYGLAILHMLRLVLKLRREGPIDVVQACNPPDLLFLVAYAVRAGGTKFVFDHHDLVPELFQSRFPGGGRLLYWLTRIVERVNFAAADAVISTNESYRRVAIERGKLRPDRVAVVRNGPDLARFTPCPPDESLRRGKPYLLAYLGIMGHQDGLDYAIRVLRLLRDKLGSNGFHCILMGSGDALDDTIALSVELGLSDMVEFPGFVDDAFIQRCLSTADVCIAPDPANAFNNVSTMMKVAEYMAMGRPIVSFDLPETRISAGDAAVYVDDNDEHAFAEAVLDLLNDPQRREAMGRAGRKRAEEALSWDVSRRELVSFYRRLLGEPAETR